MKTSKSVVIVGAGIVGINCAVELAKSGHAVTVIDRLPPGEGCSFGNAGILAASAFEPLAGPGTLLQVPGWLINPQSPLFIRWQHLPRLTPWLLQYARAGMFGDFNAACEALYSLMSPSVHLYERLLKEAGASDLIVKNGGMYAYTDQKKFLRDKAANDRRVARGFLTETLNEDDIRAREPLLAKQYKWAYVVRDIAHTLDPKGIVDALGTYAERLGVTIKQATVQDIEVEPEGVSAVLTDQGRVPCDSLVVAAGAYSHKLCKKVGDRVPLDTERGYHVMVRNPGPVPTMPIMDGGLKAWITPMKEGLRCAGTVELASLDAPENFDRARNLLRLAKRMVPSLNHTEHDFWMGCRPTLPDSLPVIGPATKVRNVFYAFGHHHLGLTGSPATAQIIGQLVSGRQPNRDISAYSVERF